MEDELQLFLADKNSATLSDTTTGDGSNNEPDKEKSMSDKKSSRVESQKISSDQGKDHAKRRGDQRKSSSLPEKNSTANHLTDQDLPPDIGQPPLELLKEMDVSKPPLENVDKVPSDKGINNHERVSREDREDWDDNEQDSDPKLPVIDISHAAGAGLSSKEASATSAGSGSAADVSAERRPFRDQESCLITVHCPACNAENKFDPRNQTHAIVIRCGIPKCSAVFRAVLTRSSSGSPRVLSVSMFDPHAAGSQYAQSKRKKQNHEEMPRKKSRHGRPHPGGGRRDKPIDLETFQLQPQRRRSPYTNSTPHLVKVLESLKKSQQDVQHVYDSWKRVARKWGNIDAQHFDWEQEGRVQWDMVAKNRDERAHQLEILLQQNDVKVAQCLTDEIERLEGERTELRKTLRVMNEQLTIKAAPPRIPPPRKHKIRNTPPPPELEKDQLSREESGDEEADSSFPASSSERLRTVRSPEEAAGSKSSNVTSNSNSSSSDSQRKRIKTRTSSEKLNSKSKGVMLDDSAQQRSDILSDTSAIMPPTSSPPPSLDPPSTDASPPSINTDSIVPPDLPPPDNEPEDSDTEEDGKAGACPACMKRPQQVQLRCEHHLCKKCALVASRCPVCECDISRKSS